MKVMLNCCPRPSVYPLFRGEDKKAETAVATQIPAATEQPKTDTVQITAKSTETQPEAQPKTNEEPKKCEGPDCKK